MPPLTQILQYTLFTDFGKDTKACSLALVGMYGHICGIKNSDSKRYYSTQAFLARLTVTDKFFVVFHCYAMLLGFLVHTVDSHLYTLSSCHSFSHIYGMLFLPL